ncbi:MAG: hypothetical protein QME78_00100 [Thermodesulfobacteriota bacterium]|nr:hypothetical protein [Thermodesulfobacteriota bacterium]
MAGKWCDEGENNILDCYLKGTARPSFYLFLYTNATEPAEAALMTGITEPSGNGYARIGLADADWTLAADAATQLQKTFTAAGGVWGNVYGYGITTALTGTAGKLICAEQFSDGPYNVQDGGSVKVTAKITAA